MGAGLFVIGINWRSAPVELREKCAFSPDEIPDALSDILDSFAVEEAMMISTCNRVEIYGATQPRAEPADMERATSEVRSYFARSRRIPPEELGEAVYERVDADAVSHIFRVASSLDSLVVGEAQILGQLKDAYGTAVRAKTTGPLLGRCLEKAFGVAKRVRTETEISRGAANVSSVAVELAAHVFGELAGKHVLVVGAGKMSALAARHLRRAGAGAVVVTNRSPERAEKLAAEIEAVARPWDKLEELFSNADVVITSTGSKVPVLTKSLVKKAMKRRKYKPVVIVDIAVPRDVEPAVSKIDGVYSFDIDDLRKVVDKNLTERQKEAIDAHRIVQGEVLQFQRWVRSQRVVPTIRSLREHFTSVADAETEKVLKSLEGDTTPSQREKAVRRLGQLIVNKLLHLPMNALKEDDRDVETLVKAAEKLFKLSTPAEETRPAITEPTPAPAKTRGSG